MFDLIFAKAKVNDVLRDAEKARLVEKANHLRKNQSRQRLAKLACRFGLTQTC